MILVTGGAGFIGTNLIDRLVKDKEGVILFDKKISKRTDVNIFKGDLSNEKDISFFIKNFGQVDTIIHLGAIARIHTSMKEPKKVLLNNIVSTINILDYAKDFNIPVIYAGSSSKFAGVNKSPYAFSKHKGEELCKLYNKNYNLKTYICRFYNVYGKHQIEKGKYSTVIGIFEKQFRENKPLTIVGDGTQIRDFTHIDDIVDGIIKAKNMIINSKKTYLEFDFGTGVEYSINDIANMFGADYPKKYLKNRKGEYDYSLADNNYTKNILNWSPRKKLTNYIKNTINP
ncbi:MAG: putative 3 beta-hydroxysteroid dehydrogenase/Delta 5--_4-isomerase [Prokaryotic dsDNA virus sp.]|nr:MAG: putative 3 beta-hydroxysteroid dehydrogenase/Delta 5-->4-isomerase [Prokaryotic dsDNA virus sp.]|tara:strand:+ start:18958 stop:19815 length:858 start_codon:yes stop_codon:yes gene_type:complete